MTTSDTPAMSSGRSIGGRKRSPRMDRG
jgi:hypothetical protein